MTKTWQTACPDCAKRVFFFSCTCGSKVFFDQLGAPWPHHEDVCVGHLVRVLRNADGLSFAQIERRLEDEAERRGAVVPANVRTLMRTLNFRETGAPTILDLTPGVEKRDFVGTVMVINRVNLFKRLEVPDNAISRKILVPYLAEEHVMMVVRGNVNDHTGFAGQVEALAKKAMVDEKGIRRGTVLTVSLEPKIIGRERLWIVQDLEASRDR